MVNKYKLGDTIAALATYPAAAAINVIKISGPGALNAAYKIFKPKRKKDIRRQKTFTLHYGWITDTDKKPIDEVLLAIMRKPNSYTREDIVEISTHGGFLAAARIFERILSSGVRSALPGEFSWRAFVNGRIDLTQAAAINNLVSSSNLSALKASTAQLKGSLRKNLSLIKEKLFSLYVNLEASLNFPEQAAGFSLSGAKKILRKALKQVTLLVNNSQRTQKYWEGIRCVICGRANVGKSSLLNLLLSKERAIVSETAGTTRDVIEEEINIAGAVLKIYDTAGILRPKDFISRKAQEHTYRTISEADLILFVIDGSRPLKKVDFLILDKIKEKKVIIVVNKKDLPQKAALGRLRHYRKQTVFVSSLTGQGLPSLEKAISRSVSAQAAEEVMEQSLTDVLQLEKLKEAEKLLAKAVEILNKKHTIDFLQLVLSQVLDCLGEILGEKFSADVLESIFGKFCIGK